MSGPQKVYVIDPARKSSSPTGKEIPKYLQSSGGRGGGKGRGDAGGSKSSGVPLVMSYMTGPLSVLATSKGRSSRAWATVSVTGFLTAMAAAWMWSTVSWSGHDDAAGVAALILASAAALICCSAWARAVIVAWKHEAPTIRRSPDWMRSGPAAGLFGSVFPGMGLYVSGNPVRSTLALWTICIAGISAMILSRATWLWGLNSRAGALSMDPDTLERLFIAAAAMTVVGVIAWVVQALDGMRLAGLGSRKKAVPRGNVFSIALIASLVLMAITFEPSVIARALDRSASTAAEHGMKAIPFRLARAASALDPSKPAYTIRAIEMAERNGEHRYAEAAREDLMRRLEPSLKLLQEEGMIVAAGRAGDSPGIEGGPDAVLPAEIMIYGWSFAGGLP